MVNTDLLGAGMSNKIPFAVLAIHPNSGIEILAVLADSHKQALRTAANICVQRQQPDLSIVAAFSLAEIGNIQKILERIGFIGEGNGMQPEQVELTERQLNVEYGDFEDEIGFFEEQNQHVEQRFPTRKRDMYDLDEYGTPQPKGTVAAAPKTDDETSGATSSKGNTSKKTKPLKKSKEKNLSNSSQFEGSLSQAQDNPPSNATSEDATQSLKDLDLSQGKKTNDGKSNVFLDDYYQD